VIDTGVLAEAMQEDDGRAKEKTLPVPPAGGTSGQRTGDLISHLDVLIGAVELPILSRRRPEAAGL
jgi:hypothetical protein